MPISGGIEKALFKGKEIGCEVIQIFTHNTSSWYIKPLSQEQIDLFMKAKEKTGIDTVSVHVGYLINLASQHMEFLNLLPFLPPLVKP